MQQRPRNDNFRPKPHSVLGVLPIAHLSPKMCHEAHPSLLGLPRWGPTMLPNMHPVPGAFLHPLPTPNLNHSNQLEAHRCNVTPTNVASPNNVAPNNAAPKCGVARKWWRQTMRRQNVASQKNVASSNNVAPSNAASQESVASPSNVAPNNAAPKCGVTGKCGVAEQCGAKQCGAKCGVAGKCGVAEQCGAKQCGATWLRNVSS